METPEDVATTSADEENPPVESQSFPDLSVLSRLAEFTSESTVNEIRTCFEIATRGTVAAGQSTAFFTINAVKQVLRSSSMQSLLARQPSSPRSTFVNEHASSNCQGSSLIAVDTACKSQEFSDSSWMVRTENDRSPSTHFEDFNATQTQKTDTKSPFDMQTLLASLANLPENVQHQVMYKLYMLGDSRDRSNVLKDISEGWSSACAGGTKLECTVASTLALYPASNNESVMDVANGKNSGNQSGNASDSGGGLSTSKQLTPRMKFGNDEKCSMLDFQLKANAPEGAGSHLALHFNNKCSVSNELRLPSSNPSHHVHSSELQKNRSSDEMHVRFGNWHLSSNTEQQYTEEKSGLTTANKSHGVSLSPREIQRMHLGEPLHACPVCKKTFRYANMLKVHAKFRHNETHPFPCTICEQKFDKYPSLTQHMYSHGVSPTYECELCGETFSYQSRLIRHNRLAHYEVFGLPRPAHCMIYPVFTTATEKAMMARRASAVPTSRTEEPGTPEHSREEQLFPCVFCGKKFSKKALLSQHMKSHEFSTTYECETCGQTFSFQSSLAKHRLVHSDADRHACSVCELTFSHPNNLKRHQLTHLNSTDVKLQTKKTPCAVPSSRTEPNPTAMSRRGLKREFSCTFCDKSFDKEILLSQHMKSHEWRPSYKCETCGEIFNFQSSLMKHQSVHSDALGHASPPGVSST